MSTRLVSTGAATNKLTGVRGGVSGAYYYYECTEVSPVKELYLYYRSRFNVNPTARRGANQKPQFEWWESGVNPTTQNDFTMSIPCRNPQEEDHGTAKHCAWQSGNAILQSGAQRTVRAGTLNRSVDAGVRRNI
jgi:hypothetical protein